ncbi:ankyrin repeat-containing domain protein [Echria macrotheca]|uniref:Ankyrin repeat-containing domain protein n=1 Tax=Echria macrotheca TaxID=438768 RepID=A0AAJ0B458_9PEZI|nr:ankyrin repeat-containing domain protein [Echria macrotheca]
MEHRILSVVDRKPDLNQELQSQGKTTPVANTWKTDKALDTVSPRRASSCDLSCDCSCHHPATFSWALKVLPWQPTLGAIAIEYSSRGSQACTNMACRDFQAGRLIRQIRIAYHVPDWLARISIDSFFSTNAGGSPQLNIRVYNRRPAKELIEIGGPAWLIERGDIEGIKRALQDGRLSIYDKFGMNLATPLRIALGNRQIDAIKLFLDAGSDPFHKIGPNHGRSVVAIAFQESIAGDALDREIANLFPIADYVDEANFSPLHLAIIGIMHFSLSEALQDPKFEPFVNQASEDGFTPLHIAALRGDLAATKALVRMGADVSAQTIYKTEPLYFACAHGYYEVAEVLLAAGANADNQDDLGRAAVHGAAQSASKDARTTLALLVRYGVNLAILDFSGSSALHYASTYGGTGAAVQFLLEVGLDVNCRDSDGGSPIVESILYHRYDAAEILLGFGCDVSVVDNGGKGVLHHLASNGDRQMMDIFARRRIKSLSSSAKDDEGNTPLVLFNRRHANNPEGELRKAFENLLESVEHYSWINDRRDDNTGDAGDSSDDEFFDAHDMNDAEMRKEKLH